LDLMMYSQVERLIPLALAIITKIRPLCNGRADFSFPQFLVTPRRFLFRGVGLFRGVFKAANYVLYLGTTLTISTDTSEQRIEDIKPENLFRGIKTLRTRHFTPFPKQSYSYHHTSEQTTIPRNKLIS